MKTALLISIHPEYIDKILSGQKRFEFRRRIPSSEVTHLVIYATSPIQKIVAIAEIESILAESPNTLWEKTKYAAGISRQAFRRYFYGCELGYAFKIGRVFKMDSIKDSLFNFAVPQSFAYVSKESFAGICHFRQKKPIIDTTSIFIAGIHGVGKTFFSNKYLSPYGWNCYSASSIIKSYHGDVNKNKLTSVITDNQEKLLSGIKVIRQSFCDISIDGHFTLLDPNSTIVPVSTDIFKRMNLDGLIVLKAPEGEIIQRLKKRDGTHWPLSLFKRFQKEEESAAISFAKSNNIPYVVINSLSNARQITKQLMSFYPKMRNKKTLEI